MFISNGTDFPIPVRPRSRIASTRPRSDRRCPIYPRTRVSSNQYGDDTCQPDDAVHADYETPKRSPSERLAPAHRHILKNIAVPRVLGP